MLNWKFPVPTLVILVTLEMVPRVAQPYYFAPLLFIMLTLHFFYYTTSFFLHTSFICKHAWTIS